MARHPASKGDLIRARVVAPEQKFVALFLPFEFKVGALNYFYASMRLLESMQGVPADDRIVAPALMLYRHSVELALKSVFQRLHFDDGPVESNPDLEKSIGKKYGHDLKKSFEDIEQLNSSQKVPEQIREKVRELVNLLSEEHIESVTLRYGSNSDNDFEDAFPLVGLHGGLNQAWQNLYVFLDAVVDGELKRVAAG